MFYCTWVPVPKHTASSQARMLPAVGTGEVLSVLVSHEATHVLHLGQLLWAGLGWAESWPCSVLWAFPHNSSKKPSQSYRQQQNLSTPLPQSLELPDLMRPAGSFSLCSLFPQGSGQLKFLVVFLYNICKSIPLCLLWSSTHSCSSSLPDVYMQTLPQIIHVEGQHRDFLCCTFPHTVLGISLSLFCQWSCTQGSRGTLTQLWPVENTQETLIWPFCLRSPWKRSIWYRYKTVFIFSPCAGEASENLGGKESIGTKGGSWIQMYLHLWLLLLGIKITGFITQVSHTGSTKQSHLCSLCHVYSVTPLREVNFAASLNWLIAALH